MQKYSTYIDELLNYVSEENVTAYGKDMTNYISSMKEEDYNNFVIIDGKLYYLGSGTEEKEIAENLGINSSLSGVISLNDVEAIIEVIKSALDATVDNTAGIIGTKLYSRSIKNSENWNVVSDYDDNGDVIAIYGDGYYLLESDTEYTIGTSAYTLENSYVINYNTLTLALLNNYKLWSITDILVTDSDYVALNVDPTLWESLVIEETKEADCFGNYGYVIKQSDESSETDEETGYTIYGDVEIDSDVWALNFNMNESSSGNGYACIKDYDGGQFSSGFSFEIYVKLVGDEGDTTGKSYLTTTDYSDNAYALGLFCKMPSLNGTYSSAMRFGYSTMDLSDSYTKNTICKFFSKSSFKNSLSGFEDETDKIYTATAGNVYARSDLLSKLTEDDGLFYLTFVYTVYNDEKTEEYQTEHYDDNMIKNGVDKVEFYINGELYGYTYYGHDSYESGAEIWDAKDTYFFLGACPWWKDGNVYFMTGSLYAARLFTMPLTSNDVKLSYENTIFYYDTFDNKNLEQTESE